ncbi:hypothetical protein PIB30_093590 [Stylosanthes scabra]|uniref:Uncharacterized protein n=1 Tax=Stylosanthes scabra TaxID=79078 RepID=A0ABU6YTY9_9FABA|nr:hypothetical protein [Stylosanthes scabra]
MGYFIEEKVDEHPILWCELNKTVVVSTLEAKPEELIEGKASQDGKEKKDKRKLDEPGKKKSVKASGVKTKLSHMEWNHSSNLSELKGQPFKFHDDHSHNKGVDAYLHHRTSTTINFEPPLPISTKLPPFTIIKHPESTPLDLYSHHHSPSVYLSPTTAEFPIVRITESSSSSTTVHNRIFPNIPPKPPATFFPITHLRRTPSPSGHLPPQPNPSQASSPSQQPSLPLFGQVHHHSSSSSTPQCRP